MIELNDVGDIRGRKNLRIMEMSPDRQDHWDVNLQSADFPAAFENTQAPNRKIKLSVIEGSRYKPSDHPNSFLIPLVLISMNRVDDKTRCQYQHRHDTQSNSIIHLSIAASILLEDDQSLVRDNPCLLMELDVTRQDNQDRLDSGQQMFGTTGDKTPQPVIHTDVNENANGGLNIPLGQMERAMEPGDKIVMA